MLYFELTDLKEGLRIHTLYEKQSVFFFKSSFSMQWNLEPYKTIRKRVNKKIGDRRINTAALQDLVNYKKFKFILRHLVNFYYYWYTYNFFFRFEQKLIGHTLLDYSTHELNYKKEKLKILNELCLLCVEKIELNKEQYDCVWKKNQFSWFYLIQDFSCYLLEKYIYLVSTLKYNSFYELNLKILILKQLKAEQKKLLWHSLGIPVQGGKCFHYRKNIWLDKNEIFDPKNRDFLKHIPLNMVFTIYYELVYWRVDFKIPKDFLLTRVIEALNGQLNVFLRKAEYIAYYKKYVHYKLYWMFFYNDYKSDYNFNNLKIKQNFYKLIYWMKKKEPVIKTTKPLKTRDREFKNALSLKDENFIDSIFFIYFKYKLKVSLKITDKSLFHLNKTYFKAKWSFNKLKYFKLLFSIFLKLIWFYKKIVLKEKLLYSLYFLYLKKKRDFEQNIDTELALLKKKYFKKNWSLIKSVLFLKVFRLANEQTYRLKLDYRHDVLHKTLFYWYNKYWKIDIKKKKLLLLKKEKLFLRLKNNKQFYVSLNNNFVLLRRLHTVYYLGHQSIWSLDEKTNIINSKIYLLNMFFAKHNVLKKIKKKKKRKIIFNIKEQYKSFFIALYLQKYKHLKYYKNINKLDHLHFRSILKNKNMFLLDTYSMLQRILIIFNMFLYKSNFYKKKLPNELLLNFNRLKATNYYLYKNYRIHNKSLLSPFIFELALFFFYHAVLNDLEIFNYVFLKNKGKIFILKTLYYFIGLWKYKKKKKRVIDWNFGFNLKKKKKNNVILNLNNNDLNLIDLHLKQKQCKYNTLNQKMLLSKEKLDDLISFFKTIHINDILFYYTVFYKSYQNNEENKQLYSLFKKYWQLSNLYKVKIKLPFLIHNAFINYNKLWIYRIKKVYIKQIQINIEKKNRISAFIKQSFINFYYGWGIKGNRVYKWSFFVDFFSFLYRKAYPSSKQANFENIEDFVDFDSFKDFKDIAIFKDFWVFKSINFLSITNSNDNVDFDYFYPCVVLKQEIENELYTIYIEHLKTVYMPKIFISIREQKHLDKQAYDAVFGEKETEVKKKKRVKKLTEKQLVQKELKDKANARLEKELAEKEKERIEKELVEKEKEFIENEIVKVQNKKVREEKKKNRLEKEQEILEKKQEILEKKQQIAEAVNQKELLVQKKIGVKKKSKLKKKSKVKKKVSKKKLIEKVNENNNYEKKNIESLLKIDLIKQDILKKKKELIEKEQQLIEKEKELELIKTKKKKSVLKKKKKIILLPSKKDKRIKSIIKEKKMTDEELEAMIKLYNPKPKIHYNMGFFYEDEYRDEPIYPIIKPEKPEGPTLNLFWCDYHLSLASGRIMKPIVYDRMRGNSIKDKVMNTNILMIGSFISSIIANFYDYMEVDTVLFKANTAELNANIMLLKRKLNNVNELIVIANRIMKSLSYVTQEKKKVEKINNVYDVRLRYWNMSLIVKNVVYVSNEFLTRFRFICRNCNYIKVSKMHYKLMIDTQKIIYNKLLDKDNIYKFDFIICETCGQLRVRMANESLLYTNNWKEIIWAFIQSGKHEMFLFFGYSIYYLIRLPDNTLIYKKVSILGYLLKEKDMIFFPFFFFKLKKKNTKYKLLTKAKKWSAIVYEKILILIVPHYKENYKIVAPLNWQRIAFETEVAMKDEFYWADYKKNEAILFNKIKNELEEQGIKKTEIQIKRLMVLYKRKEKKEAQQTFFKEFSKKN